MTPKAKTIYVNEMQLRQDRAELQTSLKGLEECKSFLLKQGVTPSEELIRSISGDGEAVLKAIEEVLNAALGETTNPLLRRAAEQLAKEQLHQVAGELYNAYGVRGSA